MSVKQASVVKSQEIVGSSQMKHAQYLDTGHLIITFTKGSRYAYSGVPTELFDELVKAESPGRYLNFAIKGKFAYEELKDGSLPSGTIIALPTGESNVKS